MKGTSQKRDVPFSLVEGKIKERPLFPLI